MTDDGILKKVKKLFHGHCYKYIFEEQPDGVCVRNKRTYHVVLDTINQETWHEKSRILKTFVDMMEEGIYIIVFDSLTTSSTEHFIMESFSNLGIPIQQMQIMYFVQYNICQSRKYILYNLKLAWHHLALLKSNAKMLGYTFDLIEYEGDPPRKKNINSNIEKLTRSFIVQPPTSKKAFQIFQPCKVFPHVSTVSTSTQKKFVHIGRIGHSRYKLLRQISFYFPDIPIHLYGTHDRFKDLPNVFYHSAFVKGQTFYNIIKNENVITLSFSEVPQLHYYSNRIPMLCGYGALIAQQWFEGIENVFRPEEMLIFRKVEDLIPILDAIFDATEQQRSYRAAAKEASKRFSFESYVRTIIEHCAKIEK